MASKKLCFLFSILLSMVVTKAFAYDFEVDGIYYSYNSYYKCAQVTNGDKQYSGSVVIPSTVTYNGRTLDVKYIEHGAFVNCNNLTSIVIPNSIVEIGYAAFGSCTSLTSIELPNSLEKIEWGAFSGCTSLTSIRIPNSVQSIGRNVFSECSSLKTLVFEDGNTLYTDEEDWQYTMEDNNIYFPKFVYYGREIKKNRHYCYISRLYHNRADIQVLTFGPRVSYVYPEALGNLQAIYCMNEEPPQIEANQYSFGSTAYVNAVLYVPTGTKEKYASADGWNNFFNIKEMDTSKMWNGIGEPSITDNTNLKCEKPRINYANGKITFECETQGVVYNSKIIDSDIKSYNSNEIQLCVTYEITVYATKDGYANSETAIATLCWIDVEPKKEGITNISQVPARAIMIKAEEGQLTVEGVEENTNIAVYTMEGILVDSVISRNGVARINANTICDSVAIVKIGNKSVKVRMK